MAKVYWRNGIAWGRVQIKGVEHRASLETTSTREAAQRLAIWVAGLSDTSKWSKVETPFATAVDRFTDDHLPTLRPSSAKRYLVSLVQLAPHFEAKTLQGITKADLMAYVTTRRREGVTSGTIRRDLECLSSVFTVASDWELCDVNPVSVFLRTQRRRKALTEAPPRTRYLSHGEEYAILGLAREAFNHAAARGSRRSGQKLMILAAIALAIDTGLRSEELLGLTWDRVDLDRSELFIPKELAKGKRDRIVPLLPRARAILTGLPRSGHTTLVFWHRAGVGFYDLNHTLQALAAQAGITGIRWQDLRRTCGCRLLQDHHLPYEKVSKWLGHASIAQTQTTYAFLEIDDLHESVGNPRTKTGTPEMIEALKTLPLLTFSGQH